MEEFTARVWDVIVIGTGIGGGTVGRRLAEQGLSVLFVEKGPDLGDTAVSALAVDSADPEARMANGAWPKLVAAELDGKWCELDGMIGAGVGGTSAYYAATLERPEPHDLDPGPGHPHPTGGWPVGYEEMRPWFELAEEYFHISGEPDPLDPVPANLPAPPRVLPASDAALMEDLRRAGMHPYQTHMAARFLPGCANCFGQRCPRRCKMDGRSAGVLPALETGNATLLDRCSVSRIEADATGVQSLTCRRDGETLTLRAHRYVLAGGGLGSPSLMLRSGNEHWPDGLGNRNDLVGRNLMFHLSEIIAIWAGRGKGEGASRSISMRDLYYMQGERFGTVQSMGLVAGYGEILHAMNSRFDRSPLRRLRPLRLGLRLPARVAAQVLGQAKLFVGVLEDLPYATNRVLPDPDDEDRLRFHYDMSDELQRRRAAFRDAMRKAFRPNRAMFMGSTPQLNFAHPCGTMRFGDDPATSVLDRDCKVHGLENLYVADSSFMPTSNGVNPSLTIAANALRVADCIVQSMRPRLAAAGELGY
ncbi:GMC oxidoreductase [Paracoccus laeviglucosivorans]|uniref:Choline dehydrogenase n=1 Tax=Paracoccus laeviglucosivorans TaxID=1197861 RepID=A0A521ATK9_9RHOB|nr:GMC family oxidoreductase [Paracoccus laeviglucosivorans]SMO38156.1 Choline dehydrogenase [Paracoccus laeviglucosivorans]